MAEHLVTVTAAGGAGTSTGTGDTEVPVRGFIESVQYTYSGAPNTTTITITENGTSRSILAIPAGNTNGVAYVRAVPVNQSGAAIAAGWTRLYVANRSLHVAVAASNNAAVITVRFVVSGDYLGQ